MRALHMPRIAGVIVLLVCLAAAGQEPPPGQEPQAGPDTQSQPATLAAAQATIDEIKGDVTINSPQGAPMAAQRGMTLEAETAIDTGKGSLVLHLLDGSQVLVKPHTRVTVKAPEQSAGKYLDLLVGKIMATIKRRLGSAPSFRMGTPTAVITVRGTRFEVHVSDKGATFVEVFEGVVEVMRLSAPGSPVMIGPGYWTQVEARRGPSHPQPRRLESRGGPAEQEGDRPEQNPTGTGTRGTPEQQQQNQPQPQQQHEQENEPH